MRALSLALAVALAAPALAQHQDHEQAGGEVLGLPPTRAASGTAWQPDLAPMNALHFDSGAWDLMLHGTLFAGYDAQASRRGDHAWLSANWVMLMAGRALGGGRLAARLMLSAEPWTVRDAGYPLLL